MPSGRGGQTGAVRFCVRCLGNPRAAIAAAGGAGMMPPGAMPPGAMPPGSMPPGSMPPGSMPPGSMPPGSMPPGALPPSGPVLPPPIGAVAVPPPPAPSRPPAPRAAPSGLNTRGDPWSGRRVGDYEVQAVLRRGPLGPVYLARDTRLNRPATFKAVPVNDNAMRERLIREAQTAGSLNHPCLLAVFQVGETGGHLFIFAEHLGHGTVADWVAVNGRADPVKAAKVIAVAARGLAYAHRQSVTHRDIRPAHIHLGENGQVKLGDFGLARNFDETRRLTQTGMEAEQFLYVAPEACRGEPLGPPADVYSLAGVLFYLLAGQAPFSGGTLSTVLNAKMRGAVPDVRIARPDCPLELAAILTKALNPDPRQRIPTADAFAAELKSAALAVKAARSSAQSSGRDSRRGLGLTGAGSTTPTPPDGLDRPSPGGAGAISVDGLEGLETLEPLDPEAIPPPPQASLPPEPQLPAKPNLPWSANMPGGQASPPAPTGGSAAGALVSGAMPNSASGGMASESMEIPQSLRDLALHSVSAEIPMSLRDLALAPDPGHLHSASPHSASPQASPSSALVGGGSRIPTVEPDNSTLPTAANAAAAVVAGGNAGVGLPPSLNESSRRFAPPGPMGLMSPPAGPAPAGPVPAGPAPAGPVPAGPALSARHSAISRPMPPTETPFARPDAITRTNLDAELATAPSAPSAETVVPFAGDGWRDAVTRSTMIASSASAMAARAASVRAAPSLADTAGGASGGASDPTTAGATDRSAPPGYEILGELGRGGMGVVFKARDTRLDRLVALKMLLGGALADRDGLARFRAEAQAVAALQHPNIVQVFEIGEHDGLPFFSLEFCKGGALSSRLGGKPQPPKQAAQIIEQIARAVHAAHKSGVLHRDLKPANILLTSEGVPKLTDFGLAKRTDSKGPTVTGAAMGTPSYMSPEQVEGTRDIGPGTDVYGLGAVLYELLTGRPPFVGEQSIHVVWQVLSQDPVPPRQLTARLPADLETICLKCLQKSPKRRYASASELADDLRAYLEGQPIKARPIGQTERLIKWVQRNPYQASLFGVSALALIVLVIGAVVFSVQMSAANRDLQQTNAELDYQRDAAEKGRRAAEDASKAAREARDEADTQRQRVQESLSAEQTARADADRSAKEARDRLAEALLNRYIANARLAEQARDEKRLQLVEELLEKMRPRPGEPDLRGFEWYHLRRQVRRPKLAITGQKGLVLTIAWSANGRVIAAGGTGVTIRIIEAKTGALLGELAGHKAEVFDMSFTRDGRLFSAGKEGTLIWNLAPLAAVNASETAAANFDLSQVRHQFIPRGHGAWVAGLGVDPEGRVLSTVGFDSKVRIYKLAERAEPSVGDAHPLMGMGTAVSNSGKLIATAGIDLPQINSRIRLFTPDGRPGPVLDGHELGARALAFSPDDKLLYSTGVDGKISISGTADGKRLVSIPAHVGVGTSLAVSPNGKVLASAGFDGTVKLWDAKTGEPIDTLATHAGEVFCVRYSPDGKQLATSCLDGLVRVWDADTDTSAGRDIAFASDRGKMWLALAVSPDGKTIATAGGIGGAIDIWDAATGTLKYTLSGHLLFTTCLVFHPDGTRLISGGAGPLDQSCKVWDLSTQKQVNSIGKTRYGVVALAISSDGRRLAVGGLGDEVLAYEYPTGQLIVSDDHHGAMVNAVAISRDNRFMASTGMDGMLAVWNLDRGQLVKRIFGAHPMPVTSTAFRPDGRQLATAGTDGIVRLWDTETWTETATVRGGAVASSVTFSPDSSLMVTGCLDGLVKVWDTSSWSERATLRGHSNAVARTVFDANGRNLFTCGVDRTIRVWRTISEDELLTDSQRRAANAPDSLDVQLDLVLTQWGNYLRQRRLGNLIGARSALTTARDTLIRAGRRDTLTPEQRSWIDVLEMAIKELPTGRQ